MTLKVLTANRLVDGEVVYLTEVETWSLWLDHGRVAETSEQEEGLLAFAAAAVEARAVVDPYLIPVEPAVHGLRALSQREIIRALGPSIRQDLGKQALGR